MAEGNVPTKYRDLNVQDLVCTNSNDKDGHPTGGEVVGPGLTIHWQNGPRANAEGELQPSNGAFVEDAIFAALQRLQFFQDSEYKTPENQEAIDGLETALAALNKRRKDRAERGVEGKHEV